MLTLADRLLIAELGYNPDATKQQLPAQMLRDINAPKQTLEKTAYAITGAESVKLITPNTRASSRSLLTILTAQQHEETDDDRKDTKTDIAYELTATSIVNSHNSYWYESTFFMRSSIPFELKQDKFTDGDGDAHYTAQIIGAENAVVEIYGRRIMGIMVEGDPTKKVYTPNPHPVRFYKLPKEEEFHSNLFWRELARQSKTMMVDTDEHGSGMDILFQGTHGAMSVKSFCCSEYHTVIESKTKFMTIAKELKKDRLCVDTDIAKHRLETRIPHYQGYRFLPILKCLQ